MSIEDKTQTATRSLNAQPSSDHRSVPIEIQPEHFRRMGYRMVDRIAELLATIKDRPVTSSHGPEKIKEIVASGSPLPDQGTSPDQLLERAADMLISHSLYNGHPRFWGYITSSPAPIGMLGDLLASAVNSNVGSWQLAPVATEIEGQTVRWIASLLGYPQDCGGVLVSGGNMANFVCFLAARTAMAKYDIRSEGIAGKPFRIYATHETHTWIEKATDLFGFGTQSIRWIETDSSHRMDLRDLANKVKQDRKDGLIPAIVVGTAGTVSTGAIDPLRQIAAFCRENKLWFHIDGAYGAFAILADGVDDEIQGLRDADSIAVDPHKWLYAPIEAGCALVRNQEQMRNTFSFHPPYYRFEDEATNYVDYSLQNSRGFRALKVWLALQQVGRDGYTTMIQDDIRLAGEMYRAVASEPTLERVTHELSIVTFRYIPEDLRPRTHEQPVAEYLNKLNEELMARLKRSGELFVSNAVLDGRFVLRACIVNFRTTLKDVEAMPAIVVRYGRQTDAELRPGSI